MEKMEKTAEEIRLEAEQNIKNLAIETTKAEFEKMVKSFSEKYDTLENKSLSKEEFEKMEKQFRKDLAELSAHVKAFEQTEKGGRSEKSFNQNLAEAIRENADAIKSFEKGDAPVNITLKTVGDMSIGANFPGATPFIQEVQQNLVWNPYNRVWLADILPQATSTANSIIYPKENGQEGAVAFWDKQGNKAQVDYDFTSETAFFKWLAGFVVVEREMLDDIDWLTGYLQQKLLIGLKTAENDFILNGTAEQTNPALGLLTSATAYDGDFTNPVDKVIDAAFGQIPTETDDFYQPTNVILNPRDVVKIGLNKATGSGEYDLPQNSVAFAQGRLQIAGLDTVPTTSIDADDFLALDRNAVMFVRRMNPEIRMFEDATLAKQNKVMFRIEERVAQVIFNTAAIVKGTLTVSGK
jgi:HK97 family phage major capsid protein